MKKDKYNYQIVDEDASEICMLLEALGQPKVFYAAKRNAYFKDAKFENPFTDAEIQQLGLPVPLELETKRRKLLEAALKAGTTVKQQELYEKTMPGPMEPPAHIKERLATINPLDKMISRVNRSTIGKV